MTVAATKQLAAALAAWLGPIGPVELIDHRTADWASATFVGQRHDIRLRIATAAPLPPGLAEDLAEADLPMTGHVAADILLTGITAGDGAVLIDIEALTLVDA